MDKISVNINILAPQESKVVYVISRNNNGEPESVVCNRLLSAMTTLKEMMEKKIAEWHSNGREVSSISIDQLVYSMENDLGDFDYSTITEQEILA